MKRTKAELAYSDEIAEATRLISLGRRRERRWIYLLMLLPALGFLGVLFVYPMLDIVFRSITGPHGFTTEHYRRVVERPIYLRVFWITFQIAFTVTVLTLLLGYPLAYVLSTVRRRVASLLLIFILIPFFTSILVRTYAWMVILGPQGLINQLLAVLSLGSLSLLYNRIGVLIGMTYALLPYMVLTLYSVMRGIDRNLLQAAYNLGASDWLAFRRVFFPLSLPGVVGGSLLVFILALGYFITPRLMGGDRDQMIAMLIEYQVEFALNWNFASALAVILLVITLSGFALYNRVVGLRALFESKT
jgi:putative spermidine/putrescine transport system permease protein